MSPGLARCVAGRDVTLIRKVFDGAPEGCINLGLGQPVDPMPAAVREAAAAALNDGLVPYGPTAGLDALRERIGETVYDGAPGASVLVTAGSQQALWLAVMGLVDPGDDVLVPEPSYPAYRIVPEMIGARPVPVPLRFEDRWRPDGRALEDAWTGRTRAVLIASPSNPTGMFAGDEAAVREIAALCDRRDAWLVLDELYAPFRFGGNDAPRGGLGERVVRLGGISKAFSCMGLRVGWLQADPRVVRGLVPLHQQVALCAPVVGQHAALACLSLWGGTHFDALRARFSGRRRAALDALSGIAGARCVKPDGAFYLFADVSARARDTISLAMRLRDEAHVLTVPGEAFGSETAGFLRISFAAGEDAIREGLGRIGEALNRG